jgi:hypothetical protein
LTEAVFALLAEKGVLAQPDSHWAAISFPYRRMASSNH